MDFIYCIMAVGMMNAVLQLIVYPAINRKVGETEFGSMLFLLGILNILAPSFGLGTGNSRLVMPERDKLRNRDFVKVLGTFSLISAMISGVMGYRHISGAAGVAMFVYVIVISIYRMYASVEYRLSLEFKKQFIFYLILSIGYVAGLLFFWKNEQWYWVFMIGETMAVGYVFLTGSVFRRQEQETEARFREVFKYACTLSGSYLLMNILMNLDRFILRYMIDSDAVSQYYVLSLLGKTMAIVSGPVNSILIGYITKDQQKIKLTSYLKGLGLLIGMGIFFIAGCSVVTPIYIKLLYPNLYASVIRLNVIVNTGQIFFFLTNVLLVVILTMCDVKWQVQIQILYAVVYVGSALILTSKMGMVGFAIASFASSVIYFVIAAVVGCVFAGKNDKKLLEEA